MIGKSRKCREFRLSANLKVAEFTGERYLQINGKPFTLWLYYLFFAELNQTFFPFNLGRADKRDGDVECRTLGLD